jgi:hypothetical protein
MGLRKVLDLPELDEWVRAEHPIAPDLAPSIELCRRALREQYDVWNEIELRTEFIGPLLALVGFRGEGFSAFSGRPLSVRVGDYEIYGEVDWMSASGRAEPEVPFFLLHEYKKNVPGDADPIAQLLSAMLAVQTLNDDGRPIHGCLVVGRHWTFYLLQAKQYGESEGFDATTNLEIARILSVLQEKKTESPPALSNGKL